MIDRAEAQRILAFLVVGVVNTAFGYGIYAAFVVLGLGPVLALGLAYVAGIAWNYLSHARLVFRHRGFGALPAYVAVYVLLYAGNALALAGLTGPGGLAPLLAQILLLPVAAALSYLAIRRVMAPARDRR